MSAKGVFVKIPSYIGQVGSANLTFHLNLTSILTIIFTLLFGLFIIVRYGYLNTYSRLPPQLQRKDNILDVYEQNQDFPAEEDPHSLDDFVSTVKIFRFIERAVAHELTKNMQTRNIKAGETIHLEEEEAYCFVMDGCVEVYYKAKDVSEENYRLLTEVRNGSPISSFFSIVSLFLENEQSVALDAENELLEDAPKKNYAFPYNILARAKEDTVIAIIPSDAFKHLIETSPEAVAQLLHVILSRFQRITLATIFNYLGLKSEILTFEQNMIESATSDLPKVIMDGSLQRYVSEFNDGSPYQILITGRAMSKTSSDNGDDDSITQDILNSVLDSFLSAFVGNNTVDDLKEESKPKDDLETNIDNCSEISSKADSQTTGRASYDVSDTSNFFNNSRRTDSLSLHIMIERYQKDCLIIEQSSTDCGMFFVLDGFLEAVVEETSGYDENQLQSQKSFLIKPGGFAGYMSAFCNSKNFLEVHARSECIVAHIPRSSVEQLIDRYSDASITFAKRLFDAITPVIVQLDFALEWVQATTGQVIYRHNDRPDGIYIILNGRARQVYKGPDSADQNTFLEYGSGESLGEIEALTGMPRQSTTYAIRDTELVRLPVVMVNSFTSKYPSISSRISKGLAIRMSTMLQSDRNMMPGSKGSFTGTYKTIALIPQTSEVPIFAFASRLRDALQKQNNSVRLLSHAAILKRLGRHAFKQMGRLKFASYLADLEEKYDIIIYVATNNTGSRWNRTCITQADKIFVVALETASIEITDFERSIIGQKTSARKELIILHPKRLCPPGLTRKVLQSRIWISAHHHIQMEYRTVEGVDDYRITATPLISLTNKMKQIHMGINKYRNIRFGNESPMRPSCDDFARLARHITGKSIGLVLGGGGARGISSIGIIIALEEAGIPIDIVGGTSIGSFTGALYAQEATSLSLYARAKKFSGRMASTWRFLLDVTYPALAYTTGHEFNRGIYKIFKNSQIEDFWLPFYTNTTNISAQKMNIHNSGYAWRYVRASMSLAGLVPPLCEEGELLVDGGYMDNLTVTHMKSLGAKYIIAIDVGSKEARYHLNYGDAVSGFWVMINRMNIFSKETRIPTVAELQARLAYVSSVSKLEEAKKEQNCFYLRPPIDEFLTLEFKKFNEILDIGFKFARYAIPKILENPEFAQLVSTQMEHTLKSSKSLENLHRTVSL